MKGFHGYERIVNIGEVGKGRSSLESPALVLGLDELVSVCLISEMESASISQFLRHLRRKGMCGTRVGVKADLERSTTHGT